MAILSNPRHEKFAELLAEGKTARESYVLCGYHDNRHNAARLKSSETVRRRVYELTQAAADAHKITIESICRELDEAVQVAKSKGQANPLVSAAGLRAKLGGLLIDKSQVQVSNGPDRCDDCPTIEALAGRTADELLDGLCNSRWLPITPEDRRYLAGLILDHWNAIQAFVDSVDRRPLRKEALALVAKSPQGRGLAPFR
jgi:hypothetical protein